MMPKYSQRTHCRFRARFVVDFYCFDRELGSKSFQNSLQETNWYFENKTNQTGYMFYLARTKGIDLMFGNSFESSGEEQNDIH